MKKKFLIVPLLMLGLASCGKQVTPPDYTALYGASIKANIQSLREHLPAKQAFEGDIKSSLALETLSESGADDTSPKMKINGGFDSQYQVSTDYPKTELVLNKPSLKINASEGEDSLDMTLGADKLDLIQSMFGQYIKYSNFVSTFDAKGTYKDEIPQQEWDSVMKSLAEYSEKWIDLTSMNATSDQFEFMKKLRSITMADVEKFLVDNPILINTGSSVQDGTKYTFDVQLNNTKLVDIASGLKKTMTGEELSEEEKTKLKANLDTILVSGKVTFDSEDPLYVKVTGLTISNKKDDSNVIIVIDSLIEKQKGNFVAKLQKDEKDFGMITFDETNSEKDVNFSLTGSMIPESNNQNEKIEVFSLSGKANNGIIQELKGNLGLPNMPISAELFYKKDNKFALVASFMGQKMLDVMNTVNDKGFEGGVDLRGNKIAHWKGSLNGKTLESFAMQVKDYLDPTSQKNLVSVKLEPKGDMASGQFAIVMNETVLASGQMDIQSVGNKKFGIAFRDVSGASLKIGGKSLLLKNFDIFMTSKKVDAQNKTISIPTEVVQIQ